MSTRLTSTTQVFSGWSPRQPASTSGCRDGDRVPEAPAKLCVGVVLRTPGLTGCIVGARNARQGAGIASLGKTISEEQAKAVWEIVSTLQRDLEGQ